MVLRAPFSIVKNAWRAPSSVSYFIPAALAFLAIATMVVRIDINEQRQIREDQRATTSQLVARLGSALESNINGDVKLAQGLASTISVEPDLDQGRFEQLSEGLFTQDSQLRSLAVAPDLVVKYIYPVAPNLKLLGLDYRTNVQQRRAAIQVIDSKVPVLTGPVALVQGGQGLIARYPIRVRQADGTQRFWGIFSAVVDLDRLYADSGLLDPRLPVSVAIARKSESGDNGHFFGDPKIFELAPATYSIDLGYDIWTLAAVPKAGWIEAPSGVTRSRLYSGLVLILVVGPLIWVGQLMKQRHRNLLALQEREDKLETLSHRLQLALEASKIGVWEFDETTGELLWDERMRELYFVPPERITRAYEDWKNALHPDDLAGAEETFARSLRTETKYSSEFRALSPSGEVRHIKGYGITYRTAAGHKRIVGANWNVTDDVLMQQALKDAHALAEVGNLRLAEVSKTLEYQSLHDALTGLPNRRYLDRYLEQPNSGARHVLIHLDLDHFKEVNDTFGHSVGDEVLKASASRLRAVLQREEFAARIGGDEFVVVAPSEDPEGRGRELATTIHAAFVAPIPCLGFERRLGASLGVALQTEPSNEIRQLLVNADVALYEAKRLGRNRVEYFTDSLRIASASAKKTADELLSAIERDEFAPYFQPQFSADTLEIVGVEALARWRHPTRGILTPDKFLAVAEGLNRVADIDAVILEKSLFEATRWAVGGLDVRKVSVNISAQRLRDHRLIERLSELHINPGSLSFELLESISFDGHDIELVEAIHKIKSFGIDIEIDDFGTGHASITSLVELAPRRLKIDRKLIAPIVASLPQQRLVSSIIEIGKSLGIEIIAEGVETMAHARILKELGCHSLQGYAFARPMPSDELLAFLKAKTAADRRAARFSATA